MIECCVVLCVFFRSRFIYYDSLYLWVSRLNFRVFIDSHSTPPKSHTHKHMFEKILFRKEREILNTSYIRTLNEQSHTHTTLFFQTHTPFIHNMTNVVLCCVVLCLCVENGLSRTWGRDFLLKFCCCFFLLLLLELWRVGERERESEKKKNILDNTLISTTATTTRATTSYQREKSHTHDNTQHLLLKS